MRIRDKATDFLMIIGLTISFLVVFYGIGIYDKAISSKNSAVEERFNYEYNFNISTKWNGYEDGEYDIESEENKKDYFVAKQILSILDVNNGNVCAEMGGVGGQSVLPFDGKMYIKMNEEPKQKLEWGRYPNDEDFENNAQVIVVNKIMLSYATQKGEKYYFEIYGDTYEIIGVLDDAYQTYALGEVITFYGCLGDKTKSVFLEDLNGAFFGQEFKLESDKDITEQYNGILSQCSQNDLIITSSEKGEFEEDWFAQLISNLKALFCGLIFALSIVNCCSISFLWIKHRMNEYAIRKGFGYSNLKLFVHVSKELLPLAFFSAILTVIIQLVNIYGFGGQRIHAENILPLGIIMLVSVFFVVLIPFRIVSKVKPATAIKEL